MDNINELLNELSITQTAVFVPFSQSKHYVDPTKSYLQKPNWPSVNWKVTIYKDDREIITTPYAYGIGLIPGTWRHNLRYTVDEADSIEKALETRIMPLAGAQYGFKPGKLPEPDLADVIYSLLLDGAADFDALSFEEWCAEYGYDTDSRKAEKIYHECLDTGRKLRAGLGMETIEQLREMFIDY